MSTIVYVGPLDRVETEFGDTDRGEPFEVPDEAAGRSPAGHFADVDADGVSTFDPGCGFLAQPGNWQPWPLKKAAPKKAAPKKAAPKKTTPAKAAADHGDAGTSSEGTDD